MFDKVEINPIESFGSVKIYEEGTKSEVNFSKWSQDTKPEVPFAKVFYLNDHDSRLYLASDTYVQLVLGSGMIITGDNQKAVKALKKWINDNIVF